MSQSLKVSLSTDAVIYLPFYLAYFGGDFNDTPYGSVDIQIVGLNDIRFKQYDEEIDEDTINLNPRLRGDTFMTLDVLFGLADIGIGDVGFVNILRGNTVDDENKRKEIFTNIKDSDEDEKQDTISRYLTYINMQTVGNEAIESIGNADIKDHPDRFKKQISSTKLKIAGGLIRKPALKGIVKDSAFAGKEKTFLSKQDKRYNAFTYSKFSTSHYYLQGRLKDKKGTKFKELETVIDFGKEIEKAGEKTICFSCDFIALRMANKSSKGYFKDYHLVEDLTCSDDRLVWSGFIIDDKKYSKADTEVKNLYKAFFYAIDRCLQNISYLLEKNDSQGLHYFIRSKLTADKNKLGDVFKVLIANEKIKKHLFSFKSKSELYKNNTKPLETISLAEILKYVEDLVRKKDNIDLDRIIRFFIKDLYYVEKKLSSLYYKSLNIIDQNEETDEKSKDEVYNNHILKVIKLRQPSIISFNSDIVIYDIMKDWRKEELKFDKQKNGNWFRRFLYKNFRSKSYLLSISIIISLIGIISFIEPFFYHKPFFENIIGDHWFQYMLMPFLIALAIGLFFLIIKTNKKAENVDKEKYMYMNKDLLNKKRS